MQTVHINFSWVHRIRTVNIVHQCLPVDTWTLGRGPVWTGGKKTFSMHINRIFLNLWTAPLIWSLTSAYTRRNVCLSVNTSSWYTEKSHGACWETLESWKCQTIKKTVCKRRMRLDGDQFPTANVPAGTTETKCSLYKQLMWSHMDVWTITLVHQRNASFNRKNP